MSCINEHSYLTLCNLLCDQIALSLPPDKVYLAEARLQNLARQHTQGDINALIEKASTVADDALRTELVEAMAINETYFFRDPILSQSFLETMVPALLKKRQTDKTLRIWDVLAQRCLGVLEGHTDSVRCLAVVAGGVLVLGESVSGVVLLGGALAVAGVGIITTARLPR